MFCPRITEWNPRRISSSRKHISSKLPCSIQFRQAGDHLTFDLFSKSSGSLGASTIQKYPLTLLEHNKWFVYPEITHKSLIDSVGGHVTVTWSVFYFIFIPTLRLRPPRRRREGIIGGVTSLGGRSVVTCRFCHRRKCHGRILIPSLVYHTHH